MRRAYLPETIAMVALLTGCGGAPASQQRPDTSMASIRAAEELGAPRIPQANLHLQLAKEQSERAQTLTRNGEGEKGNLMMQRAEADAELAVALARANAAKVEADQAAEKLRALKQPSP